MTSLQQIPPPLARLFTRIDSASATNPCLKNAFDYWRTLRGGRLSPAQRELLLLPEQIAEIAFVALPQATSKEWCLIRIGAAAFDTLRPTEPRGLLTKLGNRSVAVRLRRLLHIARQTEEPLTAQFYLADGVEKSVVEVLVAPISTTDGKDAAFCAIVRRKVSGDGRHEIAA